MRFSLYTILFLALFTQEVFGQTNPDVIEGVILENQTGKPIPYTHLYNYQKQIGTVADENGVFSLAISKFNEEKDSITISSIGYVSRTVLLSEFIKRSDLTSLEKESIELNEVVISSKAYKTKEIGNFKNPDYGSYSYYPGSEIACWIPNKKRYVGHISSISVFIRDVGTPNNPFRIHLYAQNKITSGPDKELLQASIIVQAQKGNEWVIANIDSLRINIPKEGFFIGVEWLKSSSKNVVLEKWNDISITHYGQVVGMISEPIKKGSRTWSKGYLTGWVFHAITKTRIEGTKIINVVNLAVKAEISYKKGLFEKEENTSIKYKDIKKKQLKKISNVPPLDLKKYPNYSPKKLFESLYKAIETDSIIYLFAHLCSYTKEAKGFILEELTLRKKNNSWLTEEEKQNALTDFNYYIENIGLSELKNVDIDKFEVTFPNNTTTFIEKKNNRWYLMPLFTVFKTVKMQ